jgi:hypothetical protein
MALSFALSHAGQDALCHHQDRHEKQAIEQEQGNVARPAGTACTKRLESATTSALIVNLR